LQRIHALEDEKAAQEKANQAIEAARESAKQAAEFLKDVSQNLAQYLDQLRGGPGGMLPQETQLANAKSQFERQLNLARGGDRDALESITQYADQLIEAQTGWTASGPETQRIIAYVMEQLGKLPKQVDKGKLAQPPAFANGGDHDGGYAWVGERGRELAFFNQPARIYSAEQSRAMVGGGNVAAEIDGLSRQVQGLTLVVAEYARRDLDLGAQVARNTAGDVAAALLQRVRK
ncbi:MAG TPA: hypothetical protein VIL30_23840, partial [Ramlibacter sp.]